MSAPLKYEEIIIILEVFEESVRDGLNMHYTLKRLESIFAKKKKAHLIEAMRRKLFEERGSISGMFEGVLPSNLIEAISAGEKSGHMDVIFGELKRVYELKQNVHSRIKKAVAYPIGVMSILVVIFAGILVFLVPRFEASFKIIDPQKIPPATKRLFALSAFMRNHSMAFVVLSAILAGLLIMLFKRYYYLLFKVPIIKSLMTLQENATAYLLLSVFEDSGINTTRSLQSIGQTLVGPLREILDKAYRYMNEGKSVPDSFQRAGASEDVVIYLEVGDTTGSISKYFKKLSDIEIKSLDKLMNRLISIMNYLLMGIAAMSVVGLFSITLLPIYKMIGGL
ncbi:MAG: type II secretion system F family protein [Alphaproteobacteria bacterium]|uniref:Type II secretion system F family protein n=1 Tax=Candidatus Nitrobium versatile TaxID=2884831 RepID=A0A953JE79_9BACT|nr:type II secretion system F family protein [Candidatus Nitrobium versatile]